MTALAIASIRRDGGTQPRDHVSLDVARDYADAMADGAVLPPVTVFYDGTAYWLADGFHRVEAHSLLERVEIDADIRQGDRRDAILYSVGANASHGYRRSNLDKRRAVVTLLNDPEWVSWSDREIARRCNVGPTLVNSLRPKTSLPEKGSEPTRTFLDRHGNTSVMKVGAIGKKPVGPDAPANDQPCQPLEGRGSKQLRAFLSDVRAGEDVSVAAERADISPGEAKLHIEAEAKGEYADIFVQPPMGEDAPEPPPVYSPALCPATGAPLLLAVSDVFHQVASWPRASDVLGRWADSIGAGIPLDEITKASAWVFEFAAQFPEVERKRQSAVATMLERSAEDVA